MRNILFIFLVLSSYITKAQTETITISNSIENLSIHKIHPVILTNSTNVTISGDLSSDISFIVRPDSFHRITIKPQYGYTLKGQPISTVKTTKGGGTGKLTIAPNPVVNIMHVTVEDTQITGYRIIGANGNIYLQNDGIIPSDNIDINASSLPTGYYILIVDITSGKQLSAHFIKQ